MVEYVNLLESTIRRALWRVQRLLVAAVCGAGRIPTFQRSAMWALASSMCRCCLEGWVALRTDAWSQVVAEQTAVTWMPATRPILRNLGPATIEWQIIRDCLQSSACMPEQSAVVAVAAAIVDQVASAVHSVRAGDGRGSHLNSWTVLAICEIIVTSWGLCAIAECSGMTWQVARRSKQYALCGLVSAQDGEHFRMGISGVNSGVTGFRAMIRADVVADMLDTLPPRY